jgi:glucose/arabinose dehydrogenase
MAFAYGFRNPFRMAFDPGSGELIVGDVGQSRIEEVDVVRPGRNYGWRLREGGDCFNPESAAQPPESCPETGAFREPLVGPVLEYANAKSGEGRGLAVIGGLIYTGHAVPALRGAYLFGDWSRDFSRPRGTLLAASPVGWFADDPPASGLDTPIVEVTVAGDGGAAAGDDSELGRFVLGFSADDAGEAYVMTADDGGPTGSSGKVWRVVAP